MNEDEKTGNAPAEPARGDGWVRRGALAEAMRMPDATAEKLLAVIRADYTGTHAIARLVVDRAKQLDAIHGDFASPHEMYGVLAEELAEFFDEVRKKEALRSRAKLIRELVDIAAAATRAAVQLAEEADHTVTVAEVRNA